ncbi:PREDICTED: uncharacterized protein LOC106111818 isoform X2 [Papilio polytes]|uniref:uncharacterized protein LOC106111818 isoform X2 n=1 Tax=Papilio polytes TaxID=76194 RepID=UPI0006769273|nr:PREDICTED: uncharacterized protein LOC106111818 isoform X2 [Papilio polytes]
MRLQYEQNSVASELSQAINTKMDFDEEQDHVVTDSSKDNEDVEVQHTIVVSTKLKNNNRRLQNSRDENINSARPSNLKREDSGEVPVIKGYKAIETTQIFTPDTRVKLPANNFNTRHNPLDENDIYSNLGLNPVHFKPSNYYNMNWNQDNARTSNTFMPRNDRRGYLNQRTINRGTSDDVVRDFYCKKCNELSRRQGFRGCEQLRSNPWYENTTPKLKINGKLAKLN